MGPIHLGMKTKSEPGWGNGETGDRLPREKICEKFSGKDYASCICGADASVFFRPPCETSTLHMFDKKSMQKFLLELGCLTCGTT